MQRQKRPNRFRRMIVLLLFLFSFCGILLTLKLDGLTNGGSRPLLAIGLMENITSSITSPTVKPKKIYRIVIDPGHGGKDPGAEGASGKEEKVYTLSLSLQIHELLRKEPMFEPYLTRNDDTFIELEDRAKLANDLKADAFISIHGNTYIEDTEVSGTETYYYSEESSLLAQAIHESLVRAMGFRDREVRKNKLKVLSHSEVPAVLTEIGFLTNKKEEAAMLSRNGKAITAQAIVEALKHYFTESPVDSIPIS